MIKLFDVEESLLDWDGTARDVNFEAPTWTGVGNLLARLERSYRLSRIEDHEGKEVASPLPASVVATAKNGGYIHLVFRDGPAPIKHLQVWVEQHDNGSPFVELTFWPDDLEPSESLGQDFITWAESMRKLLQARRFFARYDSQGWELGDIRPNEGVFFVSGEDDKDARV
jgi:hypothetical protein